jgi:hypothetical protein
MLVTTRRIVMPEYHIVFEVVTDAPSEDEAIDDARALIGQRRWEPTSVFLCGQP